MPSPPQTPRTGGSAGTGDAGNGERRGRARGAAVRAARKAARGARPRGGHSGVSSSGPPGPLRLTSRCRCDKMHDEGSHRRRSLRRPSSMVRQKPGRFATTGLCYIRQPTNATIAAFNAPNATKPRYFVAFTRPKQKPPHFRHMNANKNRFCCVSRPWGRRGSTQKWDALPSLRSGWDEHTTPQLHMSTQHHATPHAIACDAAIFLPLPGISLPAAPPPSRKSSPRTCCYGSSPCARAQCPHTSAAIPRRTPSGSYAARRSAAAGTPSPPASRLATPPDASYASGNPSPGISIYYHRIPNASRKSTCPSDSHDAAFPFFVP